MAGASREQTQSITQINTAVGQMDKVTQSNAANAEESAAAAEELNAQAGVMKQSVAELLKLVGGESHAPRPAEVKKTHNHSRHVIAPSSMPSKRSQSQPAVPALATTVRGSIPMDGDFRDF
jgi:methyl-accepting chemotaxis protein